jgi:NADH:ubiquinone oxidoreductase subunit 6 (subunit J)
MRKKTLYLLSIIFFIIGVLSIGKYFSTDNESDDYEKQITDAAEILKVAFNDFFKDTENTVKSFNNKIKNTYCDSLTEDKMNILANKILSEQKYIKGVVLFSDKINYVFLKDKETRITTYTGGNDSLLNWERLDINLNPVSSWTDTYNFFLNQKNTNILRNISKDKNNVRWIKIKSEIPERRDLVLQVNRITTKDNKDIYVTYVFQTSDFSKYFIGKLRQKEPMISFLTKSGKVITPIIVEDSIRIKKIKEEENKVKQIFNTWLSITDDKKPHSFSFELDKNIYWTRIETLKNNMAIEAFAVTFSQASLDAFTNEISNIFLYTGIIFVLLSVAIIAFYIIKNKKRNQITGSKPVALSNAKIKELISQGESGNVEYKSSLRYDYRQGKENKALEDVILKSIAAFSNARGGILFIGVDDNGNILGLENDFNTLKKNDIDYFELHLRKLINNQFGINFSNFYLTIQFPQINGKYIAVVQISKAQKPVYVEVKNKQGQWVEKFYVRIGNSSQEISSLTEMEEYINHRFKKN